MQRVLEPALAVEAPLLRHDVRVSSRDVFRTGEDVVLAGGPYQGTRGTFLRLTADIRWADVAELNGNSRSHPVEWLSRPAPVVPEFSKVVREI